MKCQSLLSGKNKKSINLLSAERVLMVKKVLSIFSFYYRYQHHKKDCIQHG